MNRLDRPAGALCLAAIAVALTSWGSIALSLTSKRAPSADSVPSVDEKATPRGWMPVFYGEAQVSVPPGSAATLGGCPIAPVTVFLGHGPEDVFCPLRSGATTSIYIEPIQAPHEPQTGQRPTTVNGIGTYPMSSSPTAPGYEVPSLSVEIFANGSLARRVLSTLTYSPRAVAIAPGPAPPVPASWHRLSFGGISLSVPRAWKVVRRSAWGTCAANGIDLEADRVLLDRGASPLALRCPRIVMEKVAQPEIDGVSVDPGEYGPLADVGGYAPCELVNRLRICPSATENISTTLVLAVHVAGRSSPVALEIGTSGSGMRARTILWSIRS